MPHWVVILVIAVGGGLLMEGALYALFPSGMKKAMQELQSLPDPLLRGVGLGIAAAGLLLVYLTVPKV